ncbi:ATP-dependent RecD-like DNA helicase [Ligilactobacillus sp. WILCCON 0076]|uniref:ATP-dependent RecD2 DNA helicase n=1 Tax=Ligilactobacillus ubinensis TaxID=2876789 RepID=A0A9X2JLD0_9LACO|nr:ATP-dependent RecD-like DNA helicase [Ligilactobacillus ubinensis]MCP0886470.1 ATP-dependent RecD-like DNA helicase [Ligilactobacillus ubinensis]
MATELNLFEPRTNNENSYIVGQVTQVIFDSQDDFYKVMIVKIKETNLEWSKKQLTVVGNFADIKEGGLYRFRGHLVKHPTYGEQFHVDTYQAEVATTKEGLISYLSGSDFSGIGKKTAERIVKELGIDAISKILADEECLKEIGISAKQSEVIVSTLRLNNGMEQIIVGLNSFGFSGNLSNKIYTKYHERALDVIHENPYRLAQDINGIGFTRADQIAEQLGFTADDSRRIQAAIFQAMFVSCDNEGNTYATLEQTVTNALQFLEDGRNVPINPDLIADQMIELASTRKIMPEDNRVYLKKYFYAEKNIAHDFLRLTKDSEIQVDNEEQMLDKKIRNVEKKLNISYGKDQLEAIKSALCSPVFLLTGGPGTGKTTIIRGIVETFALLHDIDLKEKQQDDFPILLAAPTGRAAKRMTEMTDLPASTIHRLLGIAGHDEELPTETRELAGQLLIIDETSMVDTELMQLLIQAIPARMQVIFVGDKNQLPSVGAGQVFSDLLESDVLAKKELQHIYRQADGSTITALAYDIQQGVLPKDFSQKQSDRSFLPCKVNQVEQIIQRVVQIAIAKGVEIDDIQVLSPMYRGPAGIDALNELLQNQFNPLVPGKKEVKTLTQKFRIGDRVLHLVNKPEQNIFNGDIGKIVGINKADAKKKRTDQLIVLFDQNEVTFERKDWSNLKLAYCLSIHKAQGSEFSTVIIPLVLQFSRMLARNLLYTAVTRAKKKLILVGEQAAFKLSATTASLNRQTSLKKRLQEVFEKIDNQQTVVADETTSETETEVVKQGNNVLTIEMVTSQKIDPMIGMQGLTPAMFMH